MTGPVASLNTSWFALIGLLWAGYFVLEGFDFGVGILALAIGRDDIDRRLARNAIGPIWDGNEVWLIVAGGATFAAFPVWYASMFSGFYLALFIVLAALIVRGVSFEFRGKRDSDRWRATWDWAMAVGSLIPAFAWGLAFTDLVHGLRLSATGTYVGGFSGLLQPVAIVGGLASLALFVTHGATFLALKTSGPLADRARRVGGWLSPLAGALTVGTAAWLAATGSVGAGGLPGAVPLALAIACGVAFVASGMLVLAGRDALAFGLSAAGILAASAAIFSALFPRVMVSSGPGPSLTIWSAASAHTTLLVMTVVAAIFVPFVLGYQGWSYWVFRQRLIRPAQQPSPAPAATSPQAGRTSGLPGRTGVAITRRSKSRGGESRVARSRGGVAEVRPLVAVARPWLAGAIGVGVGQAVLLVAQAAVLARLLADAFYGELSTAAAAQAAIAVALLAVGQGLAGWAWEAYTEAASRRARAATRRRALAGAIRLAASARRLPPDGACRQVADDGEMGPGGLATLLGAGINELDAFVGRVLPRTVLVLAVPALLLAWIAHLDLVSAGLAALVLVVAPVLAALVGMDTAAAVRRRLASLERLGDRFAALIEELPVLRAFGRAQDHEQSVAASGEDVRAATLATLRVALLAGLVLELLAAVGTALVAVRLGLRLDAGQRILPQALAVLMLTPEVFLPLRRLTADFHAAATGRAVLARLAGLMAADRPADPAEQSADDGGLVAADGMAITTGGPPVGRALVGAGRGPVSVQCVSGQADPGPLGVVLDGVCLTVGGRSQPVLDEIDLRILPGERVCLTGQSGAGKSSLLRVVAGLVPASAGCSRLEGRAGGRPALGWVPQHPTVLTGTILDNVALGRPGVDERSARAALETVGLGTWLRSMPEGLSTPLSGLDTPLSLGERRRLAVARSLAGPRPRLWLLDEPTAGLDLASTKRLVAELGRITDGVTAIIATHDPAAMTLGQRTVELCLGRVRAAGREQPRGPGGERR